MMKIWLIAVLAILGAPQADMTKARCTEVDRKGAIEIKCDWSRVCPAGWHVIATLSTNPGEDSPPRCERDQ